METIPRMGKPFSRCLRKIPMTREWRDTNHVPANPQSDLTSLQWPKWKKTMILAICSLYSFLSNTALLGPAVYITIFSEDLHVSPVKASQLISYPTLVYGMGTLVTVPMYLKFGRRPILLGSIVIYLASLIGCSQCTTFEALMTCRIIQALSSGICEAIPVQLVNDVFFRKSIRKCWVQDAID
jgi:predicted MFS family arabinose efflux permease